MSAFRVYIHEAANIIEAIYPPHPTPEDVAAYVKDITRILDERKKQFGCLVDQRALIRMPQELVQTVASLNAYAELRGMVRSARIAPGDLAEAQTERMIHEAKLGVPARTFATREEAIAWLQEALRGV